jgi:hypothetical protein
MIFDPAGVRSIPQQTGKNYRMENINQPLKQAEGEYNAISLFKSRRKT